MLTYSDLPLLPTKTLGSHTVPSWLWLVRGAHERGELGPADLDEALRDAVDLALRELTEIGLDIVSDGEFFRADFTWNFHGRIRGLEPLPPRRRLGYPSPDRSTRFAASRS